MMAKRIRKRATPKIVSRTTADTTGAEVTPPVSRVIVLTELVVASSPTGPWLSPRYDTETVKDPYGISPS